MRKLLTLVSIIICAGLLNAAPLQLFHESAGMIDARFENLRETPMFVQESQSFEETEHPDTPIISRTLAFPYQNAELLIQSMTWRVFDKQGEYLRSSSENFTDVASIAQSFTFREMHGVTIRIQTQRETDTEIYTLDNLDLSVRGHGQLNIPESVSPAFIDAYKYLADNWDTSYLKSLPVERPSMLILSHASLANYQAPFIYWKRSLGMDVHVINTADAGSSAQEIRESIRAMYMEHSPDYLMIFGDTVGPYAVPTNFYPSPELNENDADDQYYAIMEGDDYFPDMLVGRFSFVEPVELIVMANKSIVYEQSPYMTDTSWMTRALAVAGNYAEGTLRPTTPVWMSRWLSERWLDYGYTQVDSVYFPPSYPGTNAIIQSIQNGVQIISYRGWGDANGWHYPSFHMSDLDDINSGGRTPIVYSIVCNTGDFANSVTPSFGEKWMRMGTTANLNGCVAFVGPSDLHTRTRLNNTIASGAFNSILDHGVRGFASSVLMGKIELYKNFPNDLEPGSWVPFYFHVYNILSDPSLNMWSLVPDVMGEEIIEGGLSYSQSTSHITINAPHLEGAMVSGTKDGESFSYTQVIDGSAILNINPEEEGELSITVSKPDWVPLVRTLSLNEETGIGVTANTGIDAGINPNGTKTIEISVKNYGSTPLTGINASLAQNPGLEIIALNSGTFDLAPGASHTLQYQLNASSDLQPGQVIKLEHNTTNPASSHRFSMSVGGAKFYVYRHEGTLDVETGAQITFYAANQGNAALQNASVTVLSRTEAVTITSEPVNLDTIEPGEVFSFTASISPEPGVWDGRMIPLSFVFADQSGYEWLSFYTFLAGTPGTDDPTGPCKYGYYAYDNTDIEHDLVPEYEWIETDPLLGGNGNLWLVMDDGVKRVELPFTFRFYGVDYDHLTISSNGWASFVHTDESYFNNHFITAALGPEALLAPYWDDLKGMKTGVDGTGADVFADMRILYWHDAANNRFIVQWNEAYNQSTIQAGPDASLEKFQIILYPKTGSDGDVVFQYHTIDNPSVNANYCTVGIENHLSNDGISYSYGNIYPITAAVLEAGRAIRFSTTGPDNYVSNEDEVSAATLSNLRNYPNPFNPNTTIAFDSKYATNAKLQVYNTRGQLVTTLHNGPIQAGVNSFNWDGTDSSGVSVSSGIYFYRLYSEQDTKTRKMLLMK
ncbi:MAG: C25 family cysteine peptidase [Candidatus Cloacimonetes bacterium]|nr:C25 family cysteine peptidase [Candidatus Cloacimonadota bacterium]